MSSGPKTTTTSSGTQANTYGYMTPGDTPDITALRGFEYQRDPSQPFRYARAHEDLHKSYQNPYGAYTTPAVRDAATRTGDMNLTQQQGQESIQENATANNMRGLQLAGLADLTRPQLVNTGGSTTGSGTSQQSGGLLQGLLMSGAQGAGAGAAA